jgi:uncharacterized membrane protein YgdD (TMEM256/DUF423 family)
MTRTFVLLGALLAFTGVAIGAFGAHGLRAHFDANPTLEPTFQTASEYHLIHALALFAAAWVYSRWPGRLTRWAGWLLFAGVVVFSGSLYILSIANARLMGAVAPLGGLAMLAGWACLAAGVWWSHDVT